MKRHSSSSCHQNAASTRTPLAALRSSASFFPRVISVSTNAARSMGGLLPSIAHGSDPFFGHSLTGLFIAAVRPPLGYDLLPVFPKLIAAFAARLPGTREAAGFSCLPALDGGRAPSR